MSITSHEIREREARTQLWDKLAELVVAITGEIADYKQEKQERKEKEQNS